MKLKRIDLLYLFLTLIISFFFIADLLLQPGRQASFDSNSHITNITQFNLALKNGDFPVVWTGGVANYGLPLGLFAHQFTSYLGAGIMFLTNDPLMSFNIILFLAIFLSSIFFYFFLRLYFNPITAFAGVFLFTFSPYRIINSYIRGALPEIFSAIFLPLILIGMYKLIKEKKAFGFYLLIFSFLGLVLNHPMMLLIYSFLFVPYFLFLIFFKEGKIDFDFQKDKAISALLVVFAGIIALGLGSYYILPLLFEVKYFYYGLSKNHLEADSFLFLSSFIDPNWYYYTKMEILTRGHVIKAGVVETLGIILGLTYLGFQKIIKRNKEIKIVDFSVIIGVVIIFFTTSYSSYFYKNLSLLSNIQFPWRMLSAFIFLPPVIWAFFLEKKKNNLLIILFIFAIAFLSFPQLYGKNYLVENKSRYYITSENPHAILVNTIWADRPENYTPEQNKIRITQGEGIVLSEKIKNSSREYTVKATTPLRLVDYTFYFPGWSLYVDGQKKEIEFQDASNRGVITYDIPKGQHEILLKFEDTKIRVLGKIITVLSIFLLFIIIIISSRVGLIKNYYAKK